MENNLENLTIGVFAKAAGVNVETIRFYQRKGLLREPDKPYGSIRRYGEADVVRVKFVKSAQRLGFSLDEIAELIFRFLRCPLIEHFQALAPGQRKSQRRRRCHFWGEAVRGRGAQPLGGWEARVSGPGGFEKGGHPPSACAVTRTGRSPG